MKQEIRLYINNNEVVFNEEPDILFTYQKSDFTNPTTVKNTFSKSFVIPGCTENNRLFDEIYDLERIQSDYAFNPSKRVPFELYQSGVIIESGYVKLDSIKRSGRKIDYEVTLYGGLGDVFYNLAFDGDGNARRMSSLIFKDDDGNTMDLGFKINKDTVRNAWDNLTLTPSADDYDPQWHTINFAPALNGLPDDFDADKVVINTIGTNGSKVRFINGTSQTTYNGFPTSYNGFTTFHNKYALAEIPEKLTEWEIRDLRSYNQRPVISVKKCIEAITDPENNGGYEFKLDENFFNDDNERWNNAWATLPMLSDLEISSQEVDITASLSNPAKKGNWEYEYDIQFSDQYSNLSDLYVIFKPRAINTLYSSADNLYTSWVALKKFNNKPNKALYGGFVCQILGYQDGQIVEGSNSVYCFSPINNKYMPIENMDYKAGFASNVTLSPGHFANTKQSEQYGSIFEWTNYVRMSLKSSINDTLTYKLRITWVAMTGSFWAMQGIDVVQFNGTDVKGKLSEGNNEYKETGFQSSFGQQTLDLAEAKITTPSGIRSNCDVSSEQLLNSINCTPCNFLLSYCKLFNLYFEKDIDKKIVYIRTRDNFYDGKVIDIDKDIDRGSEMKISPIAFDAKWYGFKYNNKDKSEFSKNYTDKWGYEYGEQKVNTGYNFDSNSKDLLSGITFNAGVQALEKSRYFVYTRTNDFDVYGMAPFLQGGAITYNLYKNTMDNVEMSLAYPTGTTATPFSTIGTNYDIFDKLQLHQSDNKAMNGDLVLCFFNGVKGTYDTAGHPVYYSITDDFQDMITLNGGPCWYYSVVADDSCVRVSALPQFSRFVTYNDTISDTWDFGKTRQLYVPNLSYQNHCHLYDIYWQSYISDMYDVNTRVVECNVNLEGKVVGNMLRHFYWFNNCMWVLTKVSDYNMAKQGTTKCTFTKVQDAKNYSYNYVGPKIPYEGTLTLSKYTVSSNGETVYAYVYCSRGYWSFDEEYAYMSDGTQIALNPYKGHRGNHIVELVIPHNTSTLSRTLNLQFIMDNDHWVTAPTLTQNGLEHINIDPDEPTLNPDLPVIDPDSPVIDPDNPTILPVDPGTPGGGNTGEETPFEPIKPNPDEGNIKL